MPPKSKNQKKAEAASAEKSPKKTKQQENAGKSASQKKKEMQDKRAADKEKKARVGESVNKCNASQTWQYLQLQVIFCIKEIFIMIGLTNSKSISDQLDIHHQYV